MMEAIRLHERGMYTGMTTRGNSDSTQVAMLFLLESLIIKKVSCTTTIWDLNLEYTTVKECHFGED